MHRAQWSVIILLKLFAVLETSKRADNFRQFQLLKSLHFYCRNKNLVIFSFQCTPNLSAFPEKGLKYTNRFPWVTISRQPQRDRGWPPPLYLKQVPLEELVFDQISGVFFCPECFFHVQVSSRKSPPLKFSSSELSATSARIELPLIIRGKELVSSRVDW